MVLLISPIGLILYPETHKKIYFYYNNSLVEPYAVSLSDSVDEVKITGGIKLGLTDDLIKILENQPNVKTIELNCFGLDVFEAKKLFKLIKHRNLNVVVNERCSDICVIPYLAGTQRWLGLGGSIGVFNSYAFPSSSEAKEIFGDLFDEISSSNGTSIEFLRKAFFNSSPASHYISGKELRSNKIVSAERSMAASSMVDYDKRLTQYWMDRKKELPMVVDKDITVIDYSVDKGVVTSQVEYNDDSFDELSLSDLTYKNTLSYLRDAVCSVEITNLQTSRGVIFRFRFAKKSNMKKFIDFDIESCD